MKEIVIFDIDNTILKGQSQALFVSYLKQKGFITTSQYILLILWVFLYKLGFFKNPKPAMEYGLSFIKNKKIEEAQEIIDDFFKDVLVKKIYLQAVDIIKNHQNFNRRIVFISNIPDILVKKISEYFKVNDYFATSLEINNNVYTGNIIGEIMYGKQKADSLRFFVESNNLSFKNSWGYGDHDSDEFYLKLVDHPNVVNPTSGLKKIALKNNWPILNFNL